MRTAIGLLVLLLVALVAPVAAVAAERWAQTHGLARVRRRVAAELGTDRVTLAVAERPLLPALLRAGGTVVEVHAEDVPVGDGAMLRSLAATVPHVRADVGDRALTTGLGGFTATIDERELGALVRLPGIVSRLELAADGLRVWTVLGIAVDADVLVHDGALRVIPDPAQLAPLLELPGVGAFRRAIEGAGLRLELPALPFDATVEALSFRVGQVVATGRLPAQRFRSR
jgi:hypothetical protein